MGPCPLSFLLVFAACLSDSKESLTRAEKLYKNEDRTGTVLFEKSDSGKHCWSSEEVAILNSRRMFQDILPNVNVINYQNDRYIAMLMDYFHICLECVRKLSIGKTKHLMLKALADTMGGYLKVYILPMTKRSYYAGNIKYRNAKRLLELFEELKNFLHTNGDGWRKSVLLEPKQLKVDPIVIPRSKSSMACNGLVTFSAPALENYDRGYQKFRVKKRISARRRQRIRKRLAMDSDGESDSGPIIVPLPFIDDDIEPNSIALPFKHDNLQSLHSEKSAFALVKYYIASVNCIESKSRSKVELANFNRDFYDWLTSSVRPHLEDEKWYPAFGGVLRVMASLKESGFGVDANNKGRSNAGEYRVTPKFITETMAKQPIDDSGLASSFYQNRGDEDNFFSFGTTELVVITLASALSVWLFVGLALVCYRFLRRNSEECGNCESTPVTVLYKDADYCTKDVSPSKSSRKGTGHKFKEWWNSRLCGCPGSWDRYQDEERCLAAMSYTSKDAVAGSNSNSRGSKSIQKRRYNKSVSVLRTVSPRERRSFKNICYTSDESSSNTESPKRSRVGTSTAE